MMDGMGDMVARFDVKTKDDVIAYLIDCTLATVEDMAMKRSRSKTEYTRQKRIAEHGIKWAMSMGVDLSTTRAVDVIDGNVDLWAEGFEVKK